MLHLVKSLLEFNSAMADQLRAVSAYDEALALHGAKDFKKALPLMQECAMLGYPAAMCMLGSMYLLGQGVRENGMEAERWLVKSVDAGFDGAISLLGMAYATGKAGVPVNRIKAREMLQVSASRGDEQSLRMLRMMDERKGIFASGKMKQRERTRR